MKERPILFSVPMVRAILEGRKTQTRRIVKSKHLPWIENSLCNFLDGKWNQRPQPYGQNGDCLWVRENGWERPERTPNMMREGADTWEPYYYDADGYNSDHDKSQFKEWGFKRRPSIHMPRWASRILLEITGVRVERLQDISNEDTIAEGCFQDQVNGMWTADRNTFTSARDGSIHAYCKLWESINGPGSWDENPWVWVIEFVRVKS